MLPMEHDFPHAVGRKTLRIAANRKREDFVGPPEALRNALLGESFRSALSRRNYSPLMMSVFGRAERTLER